MTSFVFTAGQVKSAPLEVRRWMAAEIAAALGSSEPVSTAPAPRPGASLAACSVDEAAAILGRIGQCRAPDMPSERFESPMAAEL